MCFYVTYYLGHSEHFAIISQEVFVLLRLQNFLKVKANFSKKCFCTFVYENAVKALKHKLVVDSDNVKKLTEPFVLGVTKCKFLL
jgi:hypothetical protein